MGNKKFLNFFQVVGEINSWIYQKVVEAPNFSYVQEAARISWSYVLTNK